MGVCPHGGRKSSAMWHWILAHWVAVGGSTGLLTIIFTFWGRIMAFLKAWWEAQEARARAREAKVRAYRAEVESKTAERSEEIKRLAREIRNFVGQKQTGKVGGARVWKKEGFLPFTGNDLVKLDEVFEYLERERHAKKTAFRDLWYIR